ncbi:MAG: hypothetical protein MUC77_18845, partial [Chromatiaceae bacterium]|nr:hypothetical protein [Chromatiaceae bacterium]
MTQIRVVANRRPRTQPASEPAIRPLGHHEVLALMPPFTRWRGSFRLTQDRVGLTGLRPSALPHHRTCGFPHPAVEPGGLSP